MRARLPTGTTPIAASGFKNLGQFVAAVNVLQQPRHRLQHAQGPMVNRGLSLGQAIQQAKAIDAAAPPASRTRPCLQADDEIAATASACLRKVKGKS